MSDTAQKETYRDLYRQAFFGALMIMFLLFLLYMFNFHYRKPLGPEQPIPFSHRIHVTEKTLSCYVCHPDAMSTARAGVPPLETCMLCHYRIIITYPFIEKLRAHYFEGRPVQWKKVYYLPEFVYFVHSVHIHRSIDCSHCHGNVPMMDRVREQQKFEMGFCIQCHRDYGATHDCFTCHR